MNERPDIVTRHVDSRETAKLGLPLGRKIGRLDTSANYVLDDRFDHGPHDALHRRLTVVDAYSAAVDLEEILRGGIDVVIQAFGVEERYVAEAPGLDPLAEPPRGARQWEPFFEGEELVERVLMNLDEHRQFAEACADHVEVAGSGEEISRIVAGGRVAMVLMLVSGFIADSLDVLREYHRRGVRVMCPSHLSAVSWADSGAELNDPPGLTAFGREVIGVCEELGVIVDLAHCSDYTCRDALAAAARPMLATHTRARALSGSLRDMPDDLLRGVAEGGGVVCALAAAAEDPPGTTRGPAPPRRRPAPPLPRPVRARPRQAGRRRGLGHEARHGHHRPPRRRGRHRSRGPGQPRPERAPVEGVHGGPARPRLLREGRRPDPGGERPAGTVLGQRRLTAPQPEGATYADPDRPLSPGSTGKGMGISSPCQGKA